MRLPCGTGQGLLLPPRRSAILRAARGTSAIGCPFPQQGREHRAKGAIDTMDGENAGNAARESAEEVIADRRDASEAGTSGALIGAGVVSIPGASDTADDTEEH